MSTTMKSILETDAVLNDQQKSILSDYQTIRALNVFPDSDFDIVEDYEITHFRRWSAEVLANHFWGLFKETANEEQQLKKRQLILNLRQMYAKGFVLTNKQQFSFFYLLRRHGVERTKNHTRLWTFSRANSGGELLHE